MALIVYTEEAECDVPKMLPCFVSPVLLISYVIKINV